MTSKPKTRTLQISAPLGALEGAFGAGIPSGALKFISKSDLSCAKTAQNLGVFLVFKGSTTARKTHKIVGFLVFLLGKDVCLRERILPGVQVDECIASTSSGVKSGSLPENCAQLYARCIVRVDHQFSL